MNKTRSHAPTIASVAWLFVIIATLLMAASCSEATPASSGSNAGSSEQSATNAENANHAVNSAEDTAQALELSPEPAGPPPDPALAEPQGPVHQVYSLFDNRILAHPIRLGGFATSMGAPEGAKYIWGGHPANWVTRRKLDDIPISFGVGTAATFALPLSEPQAQVARKLVLRLNIIGPRQQITAHLNDTKLDVVSELPTGWRTLSFDIPAGVAKAGENKVFLKFSNTGNLHKRKAAAALAQVALLPAEAVISDAALDLSYGPEDVIASRALRLPGQGGYAWYVMPTSGARLALTVDGSAGCVVRVRLDSPQAEAREYALAASDAARRFVDLGDFEGQVVRLQLTADAVQGESCAHVDVADAGIMVPGDAQSRPSSITPPKHVVIWLVDTLRADHLSFYNPKTDVQTPNLAAFAQKATLFERAYVQGNESKVSHASLFTGVFPIVHRHLSGETRVKEQFELIPEAMKRAGMSTAGFISNGYISQGWGFAQGFDTYVNTIRESKRNNAPGLIKLAHAWLEKEHDRIFLYLGTIDPHVSYNRHEEFIGLYDANDADWKGTPFQWNLTGSQIELVIQGKIGRTDKEHERIHSLYKNEITFNDKYFGELLAELEARGMADETMVVVTSDHGDEFWEHGSAGHARTLYEELVRVPLIIYYPPLFPAGRVAEGVDVLDILPTLTDALGIEPVAGVQGASLVDLAHGVGSGYPRPAITTLRNVSYAMLLADWKVILQKSGEARLFQLTQDPTEQTDVSGAHPAELRWVLDALSLFLAYDQEWRKGEFGVPSNLSPEFTELATALEDRSR